MQYFMDRLVNRAIQHSQSERVAKFKIKTAIAPSITIARDPGSGGRVIGTKIAKLLGWQLLDKDVMLKLSHELDIPEGDVAKVDEHGRTWFADLFHSVFNPEYVSDVRYISQLKKILTHASRKNDLVILGHGANLILPPDKCLRVRVTASYTTRVHNTMKYEGKGRDEARSWVKQIDAQYNQFIRQYFGVNPHNPWNYDLVISTDQLSIDQATNVIIDAYLAKFPKEKKRLGK